MLTGEICNGVGEMDALPPERERGFGAGGFARVDDARESEGLERAADIGGSTGDSVVKLTVTMGDSTSGSDANTWSPGGIIDNLLVAGIFAGGCWGKCPVNINSLNASTSKDCRLLASPWGLAPVAASPIASSDLSKSR